MSDPGTGKTRAHLEDISARRANGGGKTLVLAPKSILQPAWGADIEKFTPHLRYIVAYASNRAKAFATDADVYITNHDAVNWLLKNKNVLEGFDHIVVDESTAFKHQKSNRSKALAKIISTFPVRRLLSGTPNPNGILDLFHQVLLVDDGARLGTSFWKFRSTTCTPIQVGPGAAMVKWVDKPGIEDAIGILIDDLTIRHRFENCISIPRNHTYPLAYDPSPALLRQYQTLKNAAVLELKDATVLPVHAAALRTKLLQVASGAVYAGDGEFVELADERYSLIGDLVNERRASIVGFSWHHQREGIRRTLDRLGVEYAIIDGSTPDKDRPGIVDDFQAGNLQTILAHPRSASHGLTLTKGTATIWSSPTDNAEYFQQFNQRIYRSGQTEATETILVQANGTLESGVYDHMLGKLGRMKDLLSLLQEEEYDT